MADKLQVSIVGLGLLGASAGLALRRYPERVRVVGHDKTPSTAARAKQMGAVERTEWNLINAVSGADRVLLALPPAELHETLKVIAQDLRPGCVILNMATVSAPALGWAAELLPENAYLVGGRPVIIAETEDTAGARAELFDGKLFCLTPDQRTSDAAANLAADLVEAMGARPLFLDPLEHDGLTAAVEHMPQVLAAALLKLTANSAAWHDMRKLAGSQYYTATQVVTEDAGAAAGAALANAANVTRWIDTLTAELAEWRQMLEAGDEKGLAAAFENAMATRTAWLAAQASGDWSPTPAAELPSSGNMLRGLLGLQHLQRPKKGK